MCARKTKIKEKEITEIAPPSSWEIVFYNDNYTPQSFVRAVLFNYFGLNGSQANDFIAKAEKNGKAGIGDYPKAIAITKSDDINKCANEVGFKLKTEAKRK